MHIHIKYKSSALLELAFNLALSGEASAQVPAAPDVVVCFAGFASTNDRSDSKPFVYINVCVWN